MDRSALFTPGERLGWIFRDRRTLIREFPERRPPPPLIHPEPLDRLATAEVGLAGRVAQALLFGLLGAVVIGAAWYAVGLRSEVDPRVAVVSCAASVLLGCLGAWQQVRRRRSAAEALDTHRIAVKDAYVDQVAAWQRRRDAFLAGEVAATSTLDEWGAVPAPAGAARFDVFGGTLAGWEGLLSVFGCSVLGSRQSVTIVDMSREDVSGELDALAARHALPTGTFRLPGDLPRCDLLAGLSPDEVVDVLVESMYHAGPDDRAARSTDRLLLGTVCAALGGEVTIGRLVAGIQVLMREPGDPSALRPAEREHIAEELFSDDYRRDAMPSLRRLQSYLHPLRSMGTAAQPAGSGRLLLRFVLAGGLRTAGSELLTDLLVQWLVTRVSRGGQPRGSVLVLAGADDLPETHLSRLSDACARRGVRLVALFRHLREASLRAIGEGTAGFMRLGNPEEAAAAAEFIGREHRFVVTQLTRTSSGGTSHSEGDSYARDWTRSVQYAEQSGWSDASAEQRVYEYAVEPRNLQGLPDHALLLVSHTLRGVELTGVECNPEIVLLPRVSMVPLPAGPRPAGAVPPGGVRAVPAGGVGVPRLSTDPLRVSARDLAGIEEA